MISSTLKELLVCPECHDQLQLNNSKLVCNQKKHEFNIINGIPVMLTNKVSDNFDKE